MHSIAGSQTSMPGSSNTLFKTKVQVPRKPMWAWSTTQWWVITAWLRARWNMLMLRNASVKDWRGIRFRSCCWPDLRFTRTGQGKGIGRALPRDAVLRTIQAADIAGIRALAVHAKDDKARQYFEQFDFIPSPTDPLHLFVLLKDLRKIVGT